MSFTIESARNIFPDTLAATRKFGDPRFYGSDRSLFLLPISAPDLPPPSRFIRSAPDSPDQILCAASDDGAVGAIGKVNLTALNLM